MKKILAAFLAFVSVIGLTACSELGGTPSFGPGGASEPKPDPEPAVSSVTNITFAPIDVTNDNLLNSMRLFDAMYDTNDQAMFSPLSLNMCLGMLQAGAGGSTKAALDRYLGTDDYSSYAKDYTEHAADFNFESNSYEKYKNVFEIANSVWTGKIYPMNDAYISRVRSAFSAELESLDFSRPDKAAATINAWVNKKTHEMIPTAVTPDTLSADTAAVLVNTVYFESAWSDEWWIPAEKEEFTNADGSKVKLELMRNGGDAFYENDKATAFASNYKNGMKFIGILPKEEGEFTLEGLDVPSLLANKRYDCDIYARMPKLTFDSSFPLTEVLKAAGLETVFKAGEADFRDMQVNDDDFFYVSSIIQKTRLELDDKGTRAAAVTAAIMDAAGAIMPEPREVKEVYLDRPFAFLIYDEQANEIVFVGKVTSLEG